MPIASHAHDHVSATLEVDGGFAFVPGLATPYHTDTDQLTENDAATLRALLAEAHFFDQQETSGSPSAGAADLRTYTVTASAGGRTHTVRAVEPVEDPGLRRLVDQLVAWQRRER